MEPGSLVQATQGSHRQKESKSCHQRKPNLTGSDQFFTNKGKTSKERRAKSPGRETWEMHRAKGNVEKSNKIGSIEETGNALNLPIRHRHPNKNIYPFKHSNKKRYTLKCKI